MNEEQREKFVSIAQQCSQELMCQADEREEFGSFQHMRSFYRAIAIEEASQKVVALFPSVPLDTPTDDAFRVLRKPIAGLMNAASTYITAHGRGTAEPLSEADSLSANATFAGYRLAMRILIQSSGVDMRTLEL